MLQGRNVESFDHVQRDLKVEDEDEAAKDPAFFLKSEGLSEDMKRVMAKLYTPDALKVRLRMKRACMAVPPAMLRTKQAALARRDGTRFFTEHLHVSTHPTAFVRDCALLNLSLCGNERRLAAQAFEQGGGGKKAEALRALAEAKAAAKAAAKAGGSQANSESSAVPRDGPDPRCVSPLTSAPPDAEVQALGAVTPASQLAPDAITAPCDQSDQEGGPALPCQLCALRMLSGMAQWAAMHGTVHMQIKT